MRPDSSVHWSSYPALALACTFAAGIVIETATPVGTGGWFAVAGAGAVLWMVAAVWERHRIVTPAPLLRVAALALLAVAAGGGRQAGYESGSPRTVEALLAADATGAANVRLEAAVLVGTVRDVPTEADGTWRFTVEVDSVGFRTATTREPLRIAVDGRVRVTLHNPLWISTIVYPTVRQGDRLHLRGDLSLAPRPRNPGAFDYAAYLARRGVCCTLYVADAAGVNVRGHERGKLAAFVVAGRRYVRRQLDQHVSNTRSRSVLQALLLGDRSRISEAEEKRFASTGLMHLLAVSGLHVLLIGMVLYGLLRPLLMRVRLTWKTLEVTRAVLTIGVLGFYMLLTGARPSVVRAVVMASVLIGGLLAQRSSHALNSLGVAGLILLSLRPPALFDAGFQLSMTAVAGIVTLNPILQPALLRCVPATIREHPATDWLLSMVSVSAAATLGTSPTLLFHFGQVAVAGLLLNVVAIPLTAVGLTAGVLCVATGGVVPGLASAFGASADVFIRGLRETARWGTEWLSWGLVSIPSPGIWGVLTLSSALIVIAQWPRPRSRWCMTGVAAFLLCVTVWRPVVGTDDKPPFRPVMDVVFLDVGQGDAVLLAIPDGRHILVDAGPRTRYSDAGKRVVLPYLRSRGISRLDAVVITHPDSDHLGGLPALLREMDIGTVLHSGQSSETNLYAESRHLLDSLRISHRPVRSGDTLSVSPSVRIQVLGPSPAGGGSENDGSVVLRVTYGQTTFLLTGDIERRGESYLVKTYGRRLASDVVKVPHHGSSTSSGRSFVESVSRRNGSTHAVVSVGKRNAFGLPDSSVLTRWRRGSKDLHLTSRRGAVWMRSDGREVWRVPWR